MKKIIFGGFIIALCSVMMGIYFLLLNFDIYMLVAAYTAFTVIVLTSFAANFIAIALASNYYLAVVAVVLIVILAVVLTAITAFIFTFIINNYDFELVCFDFFLIAIFDITVAVVEVEILWVVCGEMARE